MDNSQDSKFIESFQASDKTFYFAKINIHGNIFKPNLHELIDEEIPRVIENAKDIRLKHSTISFTDIERKTINGNSVILGHVTNSKKEKLRYRDGSHTYLARSEQELANSAMFIYDLKSEIIAFTTTTRINVHAFLQHFTKLLSQDEVVGEVVIKLIPEDYDIIREILAVDKVTYIKFSLIHPNPGNHHYNLYQKMVDDTSSREIEISFKDEKEGLNVRVENEKIVNETIKDGVDLVQSGYGEIELKGENYSYVESGKVRKTKKKVTKRRRFNSKTSNKKLPLRGVSTERAISKVVEFINNLY